MATTSKTERIAEALRTEIAEGRIPPGARMPSEPALMEQYSAARGTVREAMKILANDGLVISETGLGWLVRQYNPLTWEPGVFEHQGRRRDTPNNGQDAWAADVIAQGRTPSQDVQVALVPALTVVAERLHVDPETTVVVRRRLRKVDGTPWQLADSYYPEDVAAGTAIMEPGDTFVPGGLMRSAGHAQVRFRDEIRARPPTREESARLQLPPATPIDQHIRTGYNEAGRPVRVIITIAPGDRHVIVYDVSAK